MKTFIHCLTVLAYNDSDIDDTRREFYIYYATMGLAMPNPKLRASCIWTLAILYPLAPQEIIPLMPELCTFAETETWWEVHAHILSLCGLILESLSPGSPATSQAQEMALSVVTKLFTPRSSSVLKNWGLATLARGTSIGGEFADIYLETLLSIKPDERSFLLGEAPKGSRPATLISSTGLPFAIDPIIYDWYPLSIARALLNHIASSEGRQQLLPEEMQIFATCVSSACTTSDQLGDTKENPLEDEWLDIWSSLSDFVFV